MLSRNLDALIALGVAAMGLCALVAPSLFLAISPSCLITTLTGHHCWGCGMTRAVVAALRGDFALAWHYNGMVVIVLPLLCVEYFRLLRRVACSVMRLRACSVEMPV
ncbi:DUF2752 domain-containing protein [Uliginosibacterium gangwonense]|uniref:DUF2752 domain-containing protein n=1 Tax=Uliginosibacterium gangwonense TaxID=392736 RepID=UPI0003A2F593|nr:DUF2752 domain-containing protein [Uliginosibacterium gangwonense]